MTRTPSHPTGAGDLARAVGQQLHQEEEAPLAPYCSPLGFARCLALFEFLAVDEEGLALLQTPITTGPRGSPQDVIGRLIGNDSLRPWFAIMNQLVPLDLDPTDLRAPALRPVPIDTSWFAECRLPPDDEEKLRTLSLALQCGSPEEAHQALRDAVASPGVRRWMGAVVMINYAVARGDQPGPFPDEKGLRR